MFSVWALWDLTIFHGDNDFQQNWLYWSDIRLFSPENKGGQIIESDIYLRLLLAMVLAGVSCSIKRTALALYFGKKTFLNYKARMDKILADMLIISDVSQLSCEAENLVACTPTSAASKKSLEAVVAGKKTNTKALVTNSDWEEIKELKRNTSEASEPETLGAALDQVTEEAQDIHEQPSDSFEAVQNESLTDSDDNDDDQSDSDSDSDSDDDSSTSDPAAAMGQEKQTRKRLSDRASISRSEKRFKNLLDRWDEPENKATKVSLLRS